MTEKCAENSLIISVGLRTVFPRRMKKPKRRKPRKGGKKTKSSSVASVSASSASSSSPIARAKAAKRRHAGVMPSTPTFTVFVSGYDPLAQPLWRKPRQLCYGCVGCALLVVGFALLVYSELVPTPGVIALGAIQRSRSLFGGATFAKRFANASALHRGAANATLLNASRINATFRSEYGEEYGAGDDYYESGGGTGNNGTGYVDDEDYGESYESEYGDAGAYAAYDAGASREPSAIAAAELVHAQQLLAAAGVQMGGRGGGVARRSRGGGQGAVRGGRAALRGARSAVPAAQRHSSGGNGGRGRGRVGGGELGHAAASASFLAAGDQHERNAWKARRRRKPAKTRARVAAGVGALSRQARRRRKRSGALPSVKLPAEAMPAGDSYADPGYDR